MPSRALLVKCLVILIFGLFAYYFITRVVLEGLETEARGARNGLWAGPQPVLWWQWRKQ